MFLEDATTSIEDFSLEETVKTAISAFQRLFNKNFNANDIQVSVMDPDYFVSASEKDELTDIYVKHLETVEIEKYLSDIKDQEELLCINPNPLHRGGKKQQYLLRYKLATKNVFEVMKHKQATTSNPMLKPDLIAEARKKIADTDLLDHLLKHMAGKLEPDGENRFRRRHNADEVTEYWLEDDKLVDIRKKAGVADPYGTPPPGWKPGDSPTQDPACTKELRTLKRKSEELKAKSPSGNEPTALVQQINDVAKSDLAKGTKSNKKKMTRISTTSILVMWVS